MRRQDFSAHAPLGVEVGVRPFTIVYLGVGPCKDLRECARLN